MQIKNSFKKLTQLSCKDRPFIVFLLILILLPISLYTLYLFPLFPDEIAIRPYLSRLPYDYPNRASGMGVCFSSMYQAIPMSHLMPGGINWLLHGLAESPTTLRRIGLLIFLTWSTGLAIYLAKKTKDTSQGTGRYNMLSAVLLISILLIGVYPFFLVMNRNEQLFFPSLATLIYIFIISNNLSINLNFLSRIIIFLLYLISTSLILYAHGKGLFLIPFFLMVGWALSKKFKWQIFVFLIIVVYLITNAIQDYFVWKNLYKCPDFIDFEIFLQSFAINPTLIFSDPSTFIHKIYQSFIRTTEYLQYFTFRTEYQWNYLKPQKNNIFVEIINILIKINISFIFFGLLISLPFYYIKDLLAKKYVTTNSLLLILFAITLVSSLFNLTKNFYDADYLYTLLIIILIFFISENKFLNATSKNTVYLITYLCLVSIASQLILISQNLQPFRDGFSGPGITIGRYERGFNQSIAIAAEMCNIDPENSRHVITDDLTYGYFRKSHGPISYTYIFVDNRADTLERLFGKVDSSGMILDCGSMKEDLRDKSIQVNGVCCLSKSKIYSIFNKN